MTELYGCSGDSHAKEPTDDFARFMRDLSEKTGVEIDVAEAWEEAKRHMTTEYLREQGWVANDEIR